MVLVDFSYHTTDVNSYHHQMSTNTKDKILEDNEFMLYITCNFILVVKYYLIIDPGMSNGIIRNHLLPPPR